MKRPLNDSASRFHIYSILDQVQRADKTVMSDEIHISCRQTNLRGNTFEAVSYHDWAVFLRCIRRKDTTEFIDLIRDLLKAVLNFLYSLSDPSGFCIKVKTVNSDTHLHFFHDSDYSDEGGLEGREQIGAFAHDLEGALQGVPPAFFHGGV